MKCINVCNQQNKNNKHNLLKLKRKKSAISKNLLRFEKYSFKIIHSLIYNFIILFYLCTYSSDSQESDEKADTYGRQFPVLLPQMPRSYCPLKYQNCLPRPPSREKVLQGLFSKDTTKWCEYVLNRNHLNYNPGALTTRLRSRYKKNLC